MKKENQYTSNYGYTKCLNCKEKQADWEECMHLMLDELEVTYTEKRNIINYIRELLSQQKQEVKIVLSDKDMRNFHLTEKDFENYSYDGIQVKQMINDALSQQREAFKQKTKVVIDNLGECELDHHGNCQAHFIASPCAVKELTQYLNQQDK